MPEQKCNYFNRNFGNTSRIDLIHNVVYCSCADITKKDGNEIASSACRFQIGNPKQQQHSGVTYWQCEIGSDLFKNRSDDSRDRGIFDAARSYRRSIVSHLFH